MTDEQPIIETHRLTKRYGDVQAIDDLGLMVYEGEVYGFLGPNGAGKSTMINLLIGVADPTGGSATVLGHDVTTASVSIRRRVGHLPGEFGLFDRLTAREHVTFALECKGEAAGDSADLLARVGLASEADRHVDGFSTGMRRRLALGMALAGNPELLILDEPTRGLDPNGAREVREIIQRERDRGVTVFFSSHSLQQVEAVCDRIGLLHEGQLIVEGPIDELLACVEGDDLSLERFFAAVTDGTGNSEVTTNNNLEQPNSSTGVSL